MQKAIRKDDVKVLTKILSKSRPALSLELGTGTGKSTEILARYSNQVITLEQDQKFIELAKQNIAPDLQGKIDFVLSDIAVYPINKYLHGVGYVNLPLRNFDFILIDGPGKYLEEGKEIKLPGGDLFRLLPYLEAETLIYLDGRKFSMGFFKKFLPIEIIKEESYCLFRVAKERI